MSHDVKRGLNAFENSINLCQPAMRKLEIVHYEQFLPYQHFLTSLAIGQRAHVMARCRLCERQSVC